MKTLFTLLAIMCATAAGAATVHVAPAALGSGNGSDAANAVGWGTVAFERGNTYLLATGLYSTNRTLDTAASGSTVITLQSAGAVVLSNMTLSVETPYWVIDGATGGGPTNWTGGHGFEFVTAAGSGRTFIELTAGLASNITVRRVEFREIGNTEITLGGASAIYCNGITDNLTVDHCYFDNLGMLPLFLRQGSNWLIEENWFGNICGQYVFDADSGHCEGMVFWGTTNVVFRNNVLMECPSSGGLVQNSEVSDGVYIYGNVFATGTPIAINNSSVANSWLVAHNTFTNIRSGPITGDGTIATLTNMNNLVWRYGTSAIQGTHGWNHFYSITNGPSTSNANETENVTVRMPANDDLFDTTTNPFSSGYYLASNLVGTNLSAFGAEIGVDALGNARTTWSMGAYEYTAAEPETPAAPNTATITTLNVGSLIIR
jgi:hypothetical protein